MTQLSKKRNVTDKSHGAIEWTLPCNFVNSQVLRFPKLMNKVNGGEEEKHMQIINNTLVCHP